MEKGKLWFLHWQSFWIQKRRQFNLRARNIDEFLSMKLDWWTILSATFKTEKSEDFLRLWNDSKIEPSPLKTWEISIGNISWKILYLEKLKNFVDHFLWLMPSHWNSIHLNCWHRINLLNNLWPGKKINIYLDFGKNFPKTGNLQMW